MKIGVVFPQTEFPADAQAVKDYGQTAEDLGFTHILAYDHVLGANPERPGGWNGPYTHRTTFLEPLVLFSFLAGLTRQMEFATGIIILPQRQTVLAAKQAATLDVLCGGRLRLGVGLGWNEVEYISLGENFHNRGRRMEEQVELMRRLWISDLVNFQGRYHEIPDAGLNPLPIQRPIPIWFGGTAERALERMARLADGWMTNYRTPEDARPALEQVDRLLAENGRSRSDFGLEARISYGDGNPEYWAKLVAGWRELGATHISFNTMGAGLSNAQGHLAAIRTFKESIALAF